MWRCLESIMGKGRVDKKWVRSWMGIVRLGLCQWALDSQLLESTKYCLWLLRFCSLQCVFLTHWVWILLWGMQEINVLPCGTSWGVMEADAARTVVSGYRGRSMETGPGGWVEALEELVSGPWDAVPGKLCDLTGERRMCLGKDRGLRSSSMPYWRS